MLPVALTECFAVSFIRKWWRILWMVCLRGECIELGSCNTFCEYATAPV